MLTIGQVTYGKVSLDVLAQSPAIVGRMDKVTSLLCWDNNASVVLSIPP